MSPFNNDVFLIYIYARSSTFEYSTAKFDFIRSCTIRNVAQVVIAHRMCILSFPFTFTFLIDILLAADGDVS